MGTGEGRALITASRAVQLSYFKSDNPHSYFGQALIDGLRGAGQGSSGYIGLYELYQYIYTSVRAATSSQQDPVLTILQGVGPFPVALHRGGSLGPLDATAIQPEPPRGAVVEVVKQSVVNAVGRGAQAINIQAGSGVAIDQSRKVIDFGSGNKIGNISFGNVAGRDIVNITTNSVAASRADNLQDILRLVEQIRADVSNLTGVPDEARDDADDGLRRAIEAGQKGNRARMLEKLESAQKPLLAASDSPSACRLAEVLGTLLQRALTTKN